MCNIRDSRAKSKSAKFRDTVKARGHIGRGNA
jgi:hypothetical protein